MSLPSIQSAHSNHGYGRRRVLALLKGERGDRIPCFSGLITITQPALDALGLKFYQVHTDPRAMLEAAASAVEQFGLESATLPTHLCLEAEALGAEVDWRSDVDLPMWPIVQSPLAEEPGELANRLVPFVGSSVDLTTRGHIPLVLDVLGALKKRIGERGAVGAFVPGPFTLAMQLTAFDELLVAVRRAPEDVGRALDLLTGALVQVALAYFERGADYITVHEMGGSPGVLGPRMFGELVLPRLKQLIAALPVPCVLSVCGNTNGALPLLAQAGARAISVDQLNDLARSRALLGRDALLFGNLDPVAVLAEGTEADVEQAVAQVVQAGVDAIWPGCDLYPETPLANLRALVRAAERAVRR